MRRSLFLFAVFLFATQARAEPLPKAPGWNLTLIEQNQEENSYGSGTQFFALKPPDNRPAITVEYGVAQKLRAGEMKPELAYSGKEGSPPEAARHEEEQTSAVAREVASLGAPAENSPESGENAATNQVNSEAARKPAAVDNSPPPGLNEAQNAAWGDFMNWRAAAKTGKALSTVEP